MCTNGFLPIFLVSEVQLQRICRLCCNVLKPNNFLKCHHTYFSKKQTNKGKPLHILQIYKANATTHHQPHPISQFTRKGCKVHSAVKAMLFCA